MPIPWRDYERGADLLLDRPIHRRVRDRERRDDVECLGLEAAPGVEDGGVEGAGEGRLTVCGYGVRGYALLCLRAWRRRAKLAAGDVGLERDDVWMVMDSSLPRRAMSAGEGVEDIPRLPQPPKNL